MTAQDTRIVSEPKFPLVCASLPARLTAPAGRFTEATGQSPDTARIQDAIDHCVAGRAVELQADGANNVFLSGPLELKPSVTLLVSRGAVLYGTRNPREYDIAPGSCGTVNQDGHGCRPLVHAANAPHSGIMGEGVIDGQGGERLFGQQTSWWDLAHQAKLENARQNCPRLVVAESSDDFTLYGITLRNSPNFHVIVSRTDGFTAWGVKIDSPATARNTDGIDPASSRNVSIVYSWIRAGDDNIAIKAGSSGPATHITVAHNHFYSGHGMSIGSETNGGVSNVRVEDLTIDGADNGLRIKSDASRGGLVRDVRYQDVCMREVKHPLLLTPFYSEASGSLLPVYERIEMHAVHSISPGKVDLIGLDSSHALDLLLDGVFIDRIAGKDVNIAHARLSIASGGENLPLSGTDVRAAVGAQNIKSQAPLSCRNAFPVFPEGPVIQPQRKTMKDEEPPPVLPRIGAGKNVLVASDGSGEYRTVQEGIDALVAEGGKVRIRPGIYREIVHVNKSRVRLLGLGDTPSRVVIVNSNNAGNAGGTFRSATVFVMADDFSAANLTFENDYSKEHGVKAQGSQALALAVRGDRAVFRRVRLLGAQDTLYAASRSCASDTGPCVPARQFFQDCYIEGSVDFIFGDSRAVFENCEIHAIDHPQVMITAQGKRYPEQESGYVFHHCRVTGSPGVGKIFLGRPWRPYATVVFLNSELDEKVDPSGWAEWHEGETNRLATAFYAEYASAGPGSAASKRESFSRQLDEDTAEKYAAASFLSGSDGWNPVLAARNDGDQR